MSRTPKAGVLGVQKMNEATHRLAEILAMVHGRNAKKAVQAKATVCKCLQCDLPAIQGRRGLCQYHYNQFLNATRKVTGRTPKLREANLKKFDAEQVALGLILSSRQGRTPREPSKFIVRQA